MAAAMARLWAKFLPEIEQRVGVLDDAARALSAGGTLSEEQRAAAHAAAHKLAGSLGTFGMQRGTELARLAEDLLATMPAANAGAELASWANELRAMVAARS